MKVVKKQTERIKKRYDRLAAVFDYMSHMIRDSWRKDLVGDLSGRILEVGVGTGANLPFYPKGAHVIGIDFSPNMLEKAAEKIAKCEATIILKEMDIEALDFPDDTFDVIVSTCVFCSVPNPVKGFKELRRVVKPKGKIVMLEHMRSENEVIGKALDLINPLATRLSGTNVNRRTMENIEKAGLHIIEESYLMTSIMRKIILSPDQGGN